MVDGCLTMIGTFNARYQYQLRRDFSLCHHQVMLLRRLNTEHRILLTVTVYWYGVASQFSLNNFSPFAVYG